MKSLIHFIFVFMILGSFFSCIREEKPISMELATTKNLAKVPMDVSDLTEDQAASVALMSRLKDPCSTTRSDFALSIHNIVPITNKKRDTIMYAINYLDNKGYTIVSATKKYYPIIADAENGHFDDNAFHSGLSVLLEEYERDIAYCAGLDKEQLSFFSLLWRPYVESSPVKGPCQTRDLLSVVSESMAEWEDQGYLYQSLAQGCPDGMPQSEYERFCSVAEAYTNPDYVQDYLENSFILIPDPNFYIGGVDALMSTKWHQDSPFNANCFTSDSLQAKVGCIAVALGQIMRYHEWPSTFNWSNMPDYTSTSTTALFLRDIGDKVNMVYGVDASGSSFSNASYAITEDYDYHFDESNINYSSDRVIESLDNGNPVFMAGHRYNGGPGHAWVCDGYRNRQYADSFILKVLSPSYPLEYETRASYGTYHSTIELHMNWGESSVTNSWVINTYALGFSYNRSNMYNLQPNNE